MLTRRNFARAAGAAAAARVLREAALAQRAAVRLSGLPADMVWLNANENPAGPPRAALEAASSALPEAWRYHFQEIPGLYDAIAASEGLESGQVIVGAGSTEVLNMAVQAFTSPLRPLVTMHPTFEGPAEAARAMGHPIVRTPLTPGHAADVRRMAEEAGKAGGGMIYVCNPNNPTGAVTPKADMDWLLANLPRDTALVVDEAYIHFGDSPQLVSAMAAVRQGKDVVVARTFSKIYGMAGMRVGFGCARADLAGRMNAFRNNVISYVAARAAMAALADAKIVPERRAALAATRKALCGWLEERGLSYIESQTNFLMIDVGRPVRDFIPQMARQGVAPGRPFPPLDHMLRVTIGTEADMQRFREVFWKVYKS
jgi:histidinol-phosphate aminotransferase